jgi:hypothetical protein|tara:strand:+ start:245 stop:529 length:285 start_codon:yes stop_codon:yes gene_type:complete
MVRKRVTTETIKSETPKKRIGVPSKKKSVILPDDGKPFKWDKVKGVNGKIVRHKMGDKEKAIEMGKLVQEGKSRSLCVAADGDIIYFYFEIIKE